MVLCNQWCAPRFSFMTLTFCDIYIKDIELRIASNIVKFSDDTKLRGW